MRWRSVAIAAIVLLAGCTARSDIAATNALPPLAIETFGPIRGAGIATLVVIVDGGGTPVSDRSSFARSAVRGLPDSAAVAILPPSDTSEALSIERIRATGTTIAILRQRYPSARVVLVGHSTGAALAADVAGTHRALVDALVLISCPCTLPEWRRHHGTAAPSPGIADLDPLLTAGGIEPDMRAVILVGSADERTPPRFSRAYAEALALRGIATDFRVLPGRGHALLGDPETIEAVRRLAVALRARDDV